jgi:hypothetical protein
MNNTQFSAIVEVGAEIMDGLSDAEQQRAAVVGEEIMNSFVDMFQGVHGYRMVATSTRSAKANLEGQTMIVDLLNRYKDTPEIAHALIAEFMEAATAALEQVTEDYRQKFSVA